MVYNNNEGENVNTCKGVQRCAEVDAASAGPDGKLPGSVTFQLDQLDQLDQFLHVVRPRR